MQLNGVKPFKITKLLVRNGEASDQGNETSIE